MSINKEIRRGIFHSTIFKYAQYLVNLIVSIFLARLLTPEEFGVVAVINVFVLFFLMLSAFGLGEALVQNQDISEEDIFSLFIISLILSLIFSFLFFLSSSIVASFYSNDEYIKITRLLSLALFFQTANTIPFHLLRKKQKFKVIGTIYLSAGILTGSGAIYMALNGLSYYSLVYKSILETVITFLLCFKFAKIKIHRSINFNIFYRVLNYSVFQFLYNFLAFFSRNLDIIIIGKYLGAVSIGYYERAVRLFSTITGLSQVVAPVLHPVLSNHQDDLELIYKVLQKITKLISLIGIPLSVFLYFSSAEIITILYGKQWVKTIPVFEFMSLMIWIFLLNTTNVSFFQVRGRTNTLFLYGSIYFVFLLSAVAFGVFVQKSFVSVAFWLLIANVCLLIISYYLLVIKLFKANILKFLQSFKSGFIIGIVMFLLNLIITIFLSEQHLIVSLLIKVVLNGITFYILLKILKEYEEIISLIKKKI